MKLLMTADTVGGVWTHAIELCRSLQRHDVDIVLATMGAPLSPAQHDDVRRCRNVALRESQWRLEWMPEPWDDVAAAGAWLLELEREVRPDVVHLNGFAHGGLPWQAPVLMVGHSCVLSWWRAVHGCDAPPVWDRYRAMVGTGLRAASMVAAPTRTMLDALTTHYGPLPRAGVLPNGCDADVLPLGARDGFGRYNFGRYNRSGKVPEPFVLAAGRIWDEAKNFTALSTAAPRIRWPVYVAGADTDPATGTRRQLPGLHALGAIAPATLRQWYGKASIFVHPALYEPFGLAPLEAALQRTALVLADIPSLHEVWDDAAVYVPPRQSDAIAAAINELIAEPLRLATLADAARRRAAELSARRMGRAYATTYRALCGAVPVASDLSVMPAMPVGEDAACV
ncbi:glycosyltransferase family 4 protein [soil metagenome]